ncbi:MAG: hypothetical protein J7M26_05180 [Armatimonadetes bacterium]|nr:hypothetical protein [Armatimonadota bacterium]
MLGLVLVALFTSVGIFSVFLRYEIVGTGYLARTATFLLLLLIGANLLLRRLAQRLALTQRELLVIFALLLTMAALPGQEFSQHVYLNLMGLTYYSTPDIAPPELYMDLLSTPLVPSTDRLAPVIRWAYEGKPPGAPVPYAAWLPTLALWTPFWFALYWTLACWSLLFFPRWEEHEKLVFPLMQVPVELVEGLPAQVPGVLSNKLFWLGFSVGVALYVLKGLHTYLPGVPDLNLQKDAGQIFAGGPWVVYNRLPLHFYPEMVGIAYLLSSEVGFSVWFFYHFRLFQHFVRLAIGLRNNPRYSFEGQTLGGYIMLAFALVWSAREYLAAVVQRALGLPGRALPGEKAGHPYHLAFWGFIGGAAFVLVWCRQMGMSLTWAGAQWLLFPLVTLVVARVVSEAGMFIYSSPFRLNQMLVELFGAKAIGRRNVTLMFMTSWAEVRSTATQNSPYWFQALKLVSASGVNRGEFFFLAMGGILLTMLVSHFLSLHVIYTWSIPKLGWWPSGSSLNTTRGLASYLRSPFHYGLGQWASVGAGAALTAFLVHMRQRFVWWPFHPLGYVAWMGWPTDRYWLSILIGWLWKTVTVRFFGFKAFGVMRPLAFGLIAGLCFILSVWLIIHLFWPGPPLLIE